MSSEGVSNSEGVKQRASSFSRQLTTNTNSATSATAAILPTSPPIVQPTKRGRSDPVSDPAPDSAPELPDGYITNSSMATMMAVLRQQLSTDINNIISGRFAALKADMETRFQMNDDNWRSTKENVAHIEEQQNELKDKFEHAINVLSQDVKSLRVENDLLKDKLQEAEKAIDAQERQGRRYMLEVSGIKQLPNENVPEILLKLFRNLNQALTARDIDVAHRKANGQIICLFTSRKARDSIIKKRKLIKFKKASDFGLPTMPAPGDGLFINESLTFKTSKLAQAVRDKIRVCNVTRNKQDRHSLITTGGFLKHVGPTGLTTVQCIDDIPTCCINRPRDILDEMDYFADQ